MHEQRKAIHGTLKRREPSCMATLEEMHGKKRCTSKRKPYMGHLKGESLHVWPLLRRRTKRKAIHGTLKRREPSCMATLEEMHGKKRCTSKGKHAARTHGRTWDAEKERKLSCMEMHGRRDAREKESKSLRVSMGPLRNLYGISTGSLRKAKKRKEVT